MSGSLPSGLTLSMRSGRALAMPPAASSSLTPAFAAACLTSSGPSACFTSSGEIALFGPVPIHESTLSPSPDAWSLLRIPCTPPACSTRPPRAPMAWLPEPPLPPSAPTASSSRPTPSLPGRSPTATLPQSAGARSHIPRGGGVGGRLAPRYRSRMAASRLSPSDLARDLGRGREGAARLGPRRARRGRARDARVRRHRGVPEDADGLGLDRPHRPRRPGRRASGHGRADDRVRVRGPRGRGGQGPRRGRRGGRGRRRPAGRGVARADVRRGAGHGRRAVRPAPRRGVGRRPARRGGRGPGRRRPRRAAAPADAALDGRGRTG